MAHEQPYHQPYATGQQQSAPPPQAQYAEWDPTSHPQALPQWYQAPSARASQGAEQANDWVGNQQGINLSPLPAAKTPYSEYGTESGSATRSSPFNSALAAQDQLPPRRAPDRLCGVKRNVFYILLALTAFLLVVGIATGLGVGLALGHNPGDNAAAPAQTRYEHT